MKPSLADRVIRYGVVLTLLLAPPISRAHGAADPYTEGIQTVRRLAVDREYDRAIDTLTRMLLRYPGNPELLAYRGRVYLWNGMPASAILDFKQSLKRRPDPEVRRQLLLAKDSLAIVRAERHLADSDCGKAREILAGVFDAGRQRYQSGILLARAMTSCGDHGGAATTLVTLSREYPNDQELAPAAAWAYLRAGKIDEAERFLDSTKRDDPPILLVRGALAEARGEYDQAFGIFHRASTRQVSDDLKGELYRSVRRLVSRLADEEAKRTRAALAGRVAQGERLMADGQWKEAESLWREMYEKGEDRYTSGIRLATTLIRRGEPSQAVPILDELTSRYPGDQDLRVMLADAHLAAGDTEGALGVIDRPPPLSGPDGVLRRARILARQHRYAAALEAFGAAGGIGDPSVESERERVETERDLAAADEMMGGGRLEEAIGIWSRLYTSGRSRYEAGYRLGIGLLRQRRYHEARRHLLSLSEEFPADPGLYLLSLESTLLDRDITAASAMVDRAQPDRYAYLEREREDLLYGVHPNSLKVSGTVANPGIGSETERGGSLTLSQRIDRSTLLMDTSYRHRYGRDDLQLSGELFFPMGNDRTMTGDLALGFSPTNETFPDFSIRGEIIRRFGEMEGSGGYSRIQFGGEGADILIIGLSGYPAPRTLLGERLYLVPAKGTFSFLTTLNYRHSHRWSGWYSLAAGTASDRFGAQNDLKRYVTLSQHLGVEHRPVYSFSVGADLFLEYRDTLYTRYGGEFFARWWW